MQTNSLVNTIYTQTANPEPTVGMGATICMWSDRRAATVTEVSKDGEKVTVTEDTVTRTDANGMSDCQSYSYTPNPEGRTQTFTLRNNGRWVLEGAATKSGNVLSLGHRNHYHDFSF